MSSMICEKQKELNKIFEEKSELLSFLSQETEKYQDLEGHLNRCDDCENFFEKEIEKKILDHEVKLIFDEYCNRYEDIEKLILDNREALINKRLEGWDEKKSIQNVIDKMESKGLIKPKNSQNEETSWVTEIDENGELVVIELPSKKILTSITKSGVLVSTRANSTKKAASVKEYQLRTELHCKIASDVKLKKLNLTNAFLSSWGKLTITIKKTEEGCRCTFSFDQKETLKKAFLLFKDSNGLEKEERLVNGSTVLELPYGKYEIFLKNESESKSLLKIEF